MSAGVDYRLVDTTPANARRADLLEPIYPQSTVIVVTRDGRDVAASFASQSFGPDDPAAALLQWEDRMLQTHRAVANCRPGRVLTIELRDLVVSDRLGTLRRVCDVVGIDPHPDMMSWFEANVTSSGMHPGRWRGQFDADTCTALDVQYEAVCRRLAAAGVALPS